MKNISCKELGGGCDMNIRAESSQDLANKAMNHMREKHSDKLSNMSPEEKTEWTESLKEKWESAPAM
jgi:predicted small metal-binding protein